MDFDKLTDLRNTYAVKWSDALLNGADLPMWIADMDFPVADEISQALADHAKQVNFGYCFRPENFYSTIIDWFKTRHQWSISKDWIVPCPGVVPSIRAAIQTISRPADKVVVQTPAYYPFFSSVTDFGRELLNSPLQYHEGGYRIDWTMLEDQLKDASCLLLCNPHNPVGRAWTGEELQLLGELCKRYNIAVVSDDIHSDVVFSPNQYKPISRVYPALSDQCIYCFSPSKTFGLSGLNTSYVIIENPEMRHEFTQKLHTTGYYWGNSFGDTALIAAYTHGTSWLNRMLSYLEDNLALIRSYLHSRSNVKLVPMEATYLAWLDFRTPGSQKKR